MLVKPKAQSRWTWIIAAYLFLAGVGGGAYITGVLAEYFGGEEWGAVAKIGVFLGFPCVAVGCVFLLLDLGSPKNFWRAFMRPGTSWMARGTIIISIFMLLAVIHSAFLIFSQPGGTPPALGILGAVFALATVVYTGILLGASRPIAFWSTAVLPALFLVSALSTGVMAIALIGSIVGVSKDAMIVLEKLDIVLIVLEVLVLGFFLQATHRVTESRASARLVLIGSVAPAFWLGVVLLGLLIPVVITALGVANPDGAMAQFTVIIASLCGLVGGLLLRQVILSGGIHAPLKAGRFEYILTNV